MFNIVSLLAPVFIILSPNPLLDFFFRHSAIQFLFFSFTAVLPCIFTGRMYFVDFAWPWGLTIIGIYTYIYTAATSDDDSFNLKRVIVCLCYIIHGTRMGIGATFLILSGRWNPKRDLPRYEYQKIRYAHFNPGHTFGLSHMVFEIYQQCIANSIVLFVPCFLVASSPSNSALTPLEIGGFVMWALAWFMESLSDKHKLAFEVANSKLPREQRAPFCDVGLWRYSRHPNYFGEWLAWIGLALSSVDSLKSLVVPPVPPFYDLLRSLL